MPKNKNNKSEIQIGNNVWVGANVFITKGVTIDDGVIIAANSVVTKSAKKETLIGGNPAKELRENIKWK